MSLVTFSFFSRSWHRGLTLGGLFLVYPDHERFLGTLTVKEFEICHFMAGGLVAFKNVN